MKYSFRFVGLFLTCVFYVASNVVCAQDKCMSLAGRWSYRLDEKNQGEKEQWFAQDLGTNMLNLPGSLNSNGIGDKVTADTKWTGSMWNMDWYKLPEYAKYRDPKNTKVVFWLTPNHRYVGKAWYQKKVTVPQNWKGMSARLVLERVHWHSRVWLDGKEMGSNNSLSVKHVYELKGMKPGEHVITMCIDNKVGDINPGVDSHSISDNTQTNWNGVVGNVALEASPVCRIGHVDIYADIHAKKIKVVAELLNGSGKSRKGQLILRAVPKNGNAKALPVLEQNVELKPDSNVCAVYYDMASDCRLWSEFTPDVYELEAELKVRKLSDKKTSMFGMRELSTHNTHILLNGDTVFMRGTLDCCIFPKTGFPPTDYASWDRIMKVCKNYGLNHIRFHSWCPPEAAFEAADLNGVYLYVECASWCSNLGDGKPIDKYIYEESERIVREYGNHPSFCLMSYGNEPHGKHHVEYLRKFVEYWKSRDSRRLFNTSSGWAAVPECDWLCLPAPRIQGWAQGLKSIINSQRPSASYDWSKRISATQPTITHEMGQWCVYPNLKERKKYDGLLKAKNFDIFEDRLRENGLLQLADSFVLASGRLQTLCYKADIEAALRTAGLSGFQLLGLQDFPGQGSAIVGAVDPFWEPKAYVTGSDYRKFCNNVVALALLPKFVYLSGEELKAEVKVSQYADEPIDEAVTWSLVDQSGNIVQHGKMPVKELRPGGLRSVGMLQTKMYAQHPQMLTLRIGVRRYHNEWNLWVYPQQEVNSGKVVVTDTLDSKALMTLKQGGKVLLCAKEGSMRNEGKDSVAVGFSSIFWNTLWTNKQAPHTLGVLCNPQHPALKDFPTAYYSDYQWMEVMAHANAIPMKTLGGGTPVVRLIDDWFTARQLGLMVEAKVEKGSLLLCGSDLLANSDKYPEVRQLLNSLVRYMNSPSFNPKSAVELRQLRAIFK